MFSKIIKYLLKFDVLRKSLIKFFQYILKNYKNESSNNYELIDIKRIGTEEGNYNAKKFVSFLKSRNILKNISFLDIGCGDLFIYPEIIRENIREYYALDINKKNIDHGLHFLKSKKILIDEDKIEISNNFDFSKVPNNSIDIAFAQAVTSHLNLNSLIVLLKKLKIKMKDNSIFYTSFIISEKNENELSKISWKKKNKFNGKPHNVTSYFQRDPYHYNIETLKDIFEICNWEFLKIEDYDHDVQLMVSLKKKN